MGDSRFRSSAVNDPRLAPFTESAQPAWLWTADGSRILWCNAAGASVLRIDDPLSEKPVSPTDPHRRQVAQLARRLGSHAAQRLERLRGFGARFGQLTTCACSRLETADGEAAILVVRLEPHVGATGLANVPPQVPTSAEGLPRLEPTRDAPPSSADEAGDHDVVLPADPTPSNQEELLDEAVVTDEIASPIAADDSRLEEPASDVPPGEEAVAADLPAEPVPPSPAADPVQADAPSAVEPSSVPQIPLRFVWQIGADGRFSLTSEEFLRIAGARTAAIQDKPWSEVARALELDPHGRIAEAIDQGETFSGIVALWPLDGQMRVRIELSGMPTFDAARTFTGYRGFGLYRHDASPSPDVAPANADEPAGQAVADPPDHSMSAPDATAPEAPDSSSHPETEIVEPPQNVVPFPLANETRIPSLSPVENHAFDEIARRLTEKFDELNARRENSAPQAADPPEAPSAPRSEEAVPVTGKEQPAWLAEATAPARGDSGRDRMLLDLMPSGILIYRLDRLLYANRAFLDRTGFASVTALQEAGGLDALYVEPGPASASSASDDGMPLTIAHSADDRAPAAARLFSIDWDGEAAHALILQGAQAAAPAPAVVPSEPAPPPADEPPPAAAGPYEAILESATDGIVLFDRSGAIVSSNRSAQALFGMSANEMQTQNFADLFSAESQRVVLDYFESIDGPLEADPRDHGREVLGRERKGGFVSLTMTMGRTDDDSFFAVFRDLSQLRKSETDLLNARRNAERAATAKADALARISREIRDPLNTIIGFANIMIEERFGVLGNDRYADYMKDIRAAGERAATVLDDIVNISSIETGHLNLKPVSQNLNDMVESCVGVLQPQANRERVIIRTSLARGLPLVMADTQSLRQIMMNIVTTSIRCSRAGGQVIVSTAPGENGGAILRVRDTGRGLSESELAAMSSQTAPPERLGLDRGTTDLSLARALAEANRATFQIKATDSSGTLIEVVFANVRALAG